jgi:hypothetical protein
LRNNLFFDGASKRRFAGLAGLVAKQPVDAFFSVAPLPAPHRRARHPGNARNCRHILPVHGRNNNARPIDNLLGTISIGNDRRKPLAIIVIGKDANCLSHAEGIACSPKLVNPMNVSVH